MYSIGAHNAVNVTVLFVTECKFLKLVSFVFSTTESVVVLVPIVCSTLSIHVIFHPENVYPSLVGLSILTVSSYLAVFGCLDPKLHPFNWYAILYVFFVHCALNVTSLQLAECRFIKLIAFVLAIELEFVVSFPYVCSTLSIPLISQPENVYPVLVG